MRTRSRAQVNAADYVLAQTALDGVCVGALARHAYHHHHLPLLTPAQLPTTIHPQVQTLPFYFLPGHAYRACPAPPPPAARDTQRMPCLPLHHALCHLAALPHASHTLLPLPARLTHTTYFTFRHHLVRDAPAPCGAYAPTHTNYTAMPSAHLLEHCRYTQQHCTRNTACWRMNNVAFSTVA